MLSDTDYMLIDKRLKELERSVEMLRVMFPEVPVKETPTPYDGMKNVQPYKALGEIPCVFDNMPESEKMKPLCISCSCPRCSPYALSSGSLSDTGTVQVWNNNHKLADCISTTKLEE